MILGNFVKNSINLVLLLCAQITNGMLVFSVTNKNIFDFGMYHHNRVDFDSMFFFNSDG